MNTKLLFQIWEQFDTATSEHYDVPILGTSYEAAWKKPVRQSQKLQQFQQNLDKRLVQ